MPKLGKKKFPYNKEGKLAYRKAKIEKKSKKKKKKDKKKRRK